MSDVWVFVENSKGDIPAVALEAIGAARGVADELDGSLVGLVFGEDVEAVAEKAMTYGLDEVLGCDDASLATFRVEAAGPLLAELAADREPAAIIIGGSTRGKDLAAWVAAQLGSGIVTDAIELEVEDETIVVTRPVYAGKLLTKAKVTDGIQVVTLRSRAFPKAEAGDGDGDADWVDAVKDEDEVPTKVLSFEGRGNEVSLTDASIIVSGGRGVGGPEGFAPVKELADVLGGAMGASRAAVDAGWIPYDHQVGQTGKTVSPDLYIASGISGAIQHQAGMRTSKIIVAINKDAEAPIFKLAHYGIVGDLFTVLPAITAVFKERLGK